MDDELTPEQKFAAEDAETMVPRALMQGRRPDDIVAELLRLDWSPDAARELIARVMDDLQRFYQSPESRKRLVREARLESVAGIALSLFGLCMTAFSLLIGLTGELHLLVEGIGLILGGLLLAGRGWSRWRLYRRSALPFDRE